MWGFNVEFISTNYGILTTPLKEYEISTGQRACPAKDLLDKRGRRVRIIRRIEDLKLIKMCQKARLTDDEILAVVGALPAFALSVSSKVRQASAAVSAGAVFRADVPGLQHDPPSISGGAVPSVRGG